MIEKVLIMKHNANIYHYLNSTNRMNTTMTNFINGKLNKAKRCLSWSNTSSLKSETPNLPPTGVVQNGVHINAQ